MAVPPQNLVASEQFYEFHWRVQDNPACNAGHGIPYVAWHSERSFQKPKQGYAIQSGSC